MSTKPILFNTDMVRAILDGRKTVTRRVVKPQHLQVLDSPYSREHPETPDKVLLEKLCDPPYRPGDILWVREAWAQLSDLFDERPGYVYRADLPQCDLDELKRKKFRWRPSIHMPREAARLFLRVTDVRVGPLQWCGNMEAKEEGCTCCSQFIRIWDSTIKPADRDRYGWDANPWVWVIEFERCERPEELSVDLAQNTKEGAV